MQNPRNEIGTLLEEAAKTRCMCPTGSLMQLIEMAQRGCLKCCAKYINKAGKLACGTTALIETVKNGHVRVAQLLLPIEGRIRDAKGNSALIYATRNSKEMFDTVLRSLEPWFYAMILEMFKIPCICRRNSLNLREAVEKRCMKCFAEFIQQAYEFIDAVIAEAKAVKNPCIASAKLMTSLQKKLEIKTGTTELIFAVQNNRYEAVAALVGEQRDLKDANGWKASGYAASVHNPKLWALFPKDIDKEYAADLQVAHLTKCCCQKKSNGLMDAVNNKCLKCCAYFIWEDKSSVLRYSALMNAATKFNDRIVRFLMHTQAGAQNHEKKSALMYAAELNNLVAIKLLARKEAKLQNYEGTTALMIASKRGYVKVVQYLIPFEAEMQDNLGRTALMYAIRNTHSEIAKLLVPAERDIKDNEGRSAEEYARQVGNVEIQQLFKSNGAQEQNAEAGSLGCTCRRSSKSLIEASISGCVNCCTRFIQQTGQKVNQRTALMEAAMRNHMEIVKLLADKEAMLQSASRRTALMMAAWEGHTGAVKLLADKEAKIQDQVGRTALILATSKGHLEVVKILTGKEAGMVFETHGTALSQAVWHLNKDCFDVLRQSPAELQASKVTRAMLAAYDGDLHTVLQNRSEWGSLLGMGLTVLNFAFFRGRPTFVRALTRDHASRQQLVSGEFELAAAARTANIMNTCRFLEVRQPYARLVLELVCSAPRRVRSALLAVAVFFFYDDAVASLWRPFCSPLCNDLRRAAEAFAGERGALRIFSRLKNAGVLWGPGGPGPLRGPATRNPLVVKQQELAQRRLGKRAKATAGEENNAAWRETEVEATFNRAALLEARELWWKTRPAGRVPPIPPVASKRGAKLEENALAIYGAYFYAYGILDGLQGQ